VVDEPQTCFHEQAELSRRFWPPAKALLSFKGAGYYSHAGEAKREAVNTGS
jgi:hypothetical protein